MHSAAAKKAIRATTVIMALTAASLNRLSLSLTLFHHHPWQLLVTVVRGDGGRGECQVECGLPKLVMDRDMWLNAQMTSRNPSGGTGACATAERVVSLRCPTLASTPNRRLVDYILVG
jgi:hypothetical protein